MFFVLVFLDDLVAQMFLDSLNVQYLWCVRIVSSATYLIKFKYFLILQF